MYTHTYNYLYIYIYIHIHTYIYTSIYVYIYEPPSEPVQFMTDYWGTNTNHRALPPSLASRWVLRLEVATGVWL